MNGLLRFSRAGRLTILIAATLAVGCNDPVPTGPNVDLRLAKGGPPRSGPQIIVLSTGEQSTAKGINNLGQVVGESLLSGAWLWDAGTVTHLGALPGDVGSQAEAINDNGQVVGYSTGPAPAYGLRAFLWTLATGMQVLPGTLGGTNSFAWAINSNGDVAGESSLPGDLIGHAAIWRSGAITDLQSPNFPSGSSYSWGINDAGTVVGQYNPPGGGSRTFRWTEAAGMELVISYVPAGDVALGVSPSGIIVGWGATTPNGDFTAYRLENGTRTDLGTLGGRGSVAMAINDAGVIVGRAGTGARRSGSNQFAPFIWTPATGMKSLGLPKGRDYGQAWAINDIGWAVGETWTPSGVNTATMWKTP